MEPAPWSDWSDGARWRQLIWRSHSEWFRRHGAEYGVHPLFIIPGCSIFHVVPDSMHIVDLGVAHHVLRNVLFHLCYEENYLPGSTPAAKLDSLWGRIVGHYRGRQTGSQLTNLTLSMFSDLKGPRAHFPLLTTRVKAAETRHLLPIVKDIFFGCMSSRLRS